MCRSIIKRASQAFSGSLTHPHQNRHICDHDRDRDRDRDRDYQRKRRFFINQRFKRDVWNWQRIQKVLYFLEMAMSHPLFWHKFPIRWVYHNSHSRQDFKVGGETNFFETDKNTSALCGACAGILGERGLELVVLFPLGYVAKIHIPWLPRWRCRNLVTVTVTVKGHDPNCHHKYHSISWLYCVTVTVTVTVSKESKKKVPLEVHITTVTKWLKRERHARLGYSQVVEDLLS